MDCDPADPHPNETGTVWSDCELALTEGRAEDGCAGRWACAQRASDSCCVEFANCGGDSGGGLNRIRACADGCGSFEPRDDMPVATDCTSALEGVVRFGQPCEGSFACIDGRDISESAASEDLLTADVHWCGGGMVQIATSIGVGAI